MRDYRKIRGRPFESAAMPSLPKGLQSHTPSESDLNLKFLNPRCPYCGGEMEPWRDTETTLYWRCYGINEYTNEPCINNPDYDPKNPITYDDINSGAVRLRRFADWMPPRLI